MLIGKMHRQTTANRDTAGLAGIGLPDLIDQQIAASGGIIPDVPDEQGSRRSRRQGFPIEVVRPIHWKTGMTVRFSMLLRDPVSPAESVDGVKAGGIAGVVQGPIDARMCQTGRQAGTLAQCRMFQTAGRFEPLRIYKRRWPAPDPVRHRRRGRLAKAGRGRRLGGDWRWRGGGGTDRGRRGGRSDRPASRLQNGLRIERSGEETAREEGRQEEGNLNHAGLTIPVRTGPAIQPLAERP